MLWPNPSRMLEFKINKVKQSQEIRRARDKLKKHKEF